MTECPFKDAAWLIGMMPQMGFVLISMMTFTVEGVDLSHAPSLCPHAGRRVMLIDKRDKNTTGGVKGWKIKRFTERIRERERSQGRTETKAKNKDNNKDEKKIRR